MVDYLRVQRHLSQLNNDLRFRYSFLSSYVPGPAGLRGPQRHSRLYRKEQELVISSPADKPYRRPVGDTRVLQRGLM